MTGECSFSFHKSHDIHRRPHMYLCTHIFMQKENEFFHLLKWADQIESVWLPPQGMVPKKWVRWIWMCFMQNKFNFCGSIFHFLKKVHLLVVTVNENLKWTYYCVWGSENVLLTLKKARVREIVRLLWGRNIICFTKYSVLSRNALIHEPCFTVPNFICPVNLFNLANRWDEWAAWSECSCVRCSQCPSLWVRLSLDTPLLLCVLLYKCYWDISHVTTKLHTHAHT